MKKLLFIGVLAFACQMTVNAQAIVGTTTVADLKAKKAAQKAEAQAQAQNTDQKAQAQKAASKEDSTTSTLVAGTTTVADLKAKKAEQKAQTVPENNKKATPKKLSPAKKAEVVKKVVTTVADVVSKRAEGQK